MQEQKQNRYLSLKLMVAAAATVLALGGAAAWWFGTDVPERGNDPNPPTSQTNSSQNQTNIAATEAGKVEIYWLDDNLELRANPIEIDLSQGEEPALKKAIALLLAGPDSSAESSYGTTIPEETKLINLTVESDGIHLDLSPEYTSGGGSASMIGRLGQIIYTATSLEPDAQVWIDVDGQPLELLGGEGLEVTQPMTRKSFQADFGFKEE